MASSHGPRRDAAKHRFWERCVSRWRKSGLSVREFCRREALSEPLFYSWRREL
ncbi:MAG: IS66 family insertion sequence element accessory protein TnpA, partial [Pirellulales bacterium]